MSYVCFLRELEAILFGELTVLFVHLRNTNPE
jgi:hypothetical protein